MIKDDFSSYMGTKRLNTDGVKFSFLMLWGHYYGQGFMDDFGTLIEYRSRDWK